jgi:undecaprenyl-diphosphatase
MISSLDNILYPIFLSNNETVIDVFKVITIFGDYRFALFVVSLCSIWWIVKGNFKNVYILSLSVLGSGLLVWIIKMVVARPRPLTGLVEVASNSFPSAHSVIAISLYVSFYLIFYNTQFNYWKIIFLALALLIPISRLVLGVHYFTDVLAGVLIGFIVVNLSFWFANKHFVNS